LDVFFTQKTVVAPLVKPATPIKDEIERIDYNNTTKMMTITYKSGLKTIKPIPVAWEGGKKKKVSKPKATKKK
jgi:hypothetical protein